MKFNSVDFNVKYNLFSSICQSFYGSDLWIDRKCAVSTFKKLCVSYHNALKMILGMPKYFCNHYIFSISNALSFEHFVNFKILKFYHWLSRCNSPCFIRYKFYFLHCSYFEQCVDDVWLTKYIVEDVLDNDLDASLSRLYFIQNREPSSLFFGL